MKSCETWGSESNPRRSRRSSVHPLLTLLILSPSFEKWIRGCLLYYVLESSLSCHLSVKLYEEDDVYVSSLSFFTPFFVCYCFKKFDTIFSLFVKVFGLYLFFTFYPRRETQFPFLLIKPQTKDTLIPLIITRWSDFCFSLFLDDWFSPKPFLQVKYFCPNSFTDDWDEFWRLISSVLSGFVSLLSYKVYCTFNILRFFLQVVCCYTRT